jgi:hypothetical protein
MLVLIPVAEIVVLLPEPGAAAFVTAPKAWIAIAVRTAVAAVFALPWYIYSLSSVRVRNTFVR